MTEVAKQTDSVVTITGLHHVGIAVNDIDRAVEFYTTVLGMEPVEGGVRNGNGRMHFMGSNVPQEVPVDPRQKTDWEEYIERHKRERGEAPVTNFVTLRAGSSLVALFERIIPEERDTLVQNGIAHQSFHISPEDMDRLEELKHRGDSGIRFHTGPVYRWPTGRALYLWDTEGNYIELESEEDLPARLGMQPTS